MSYGLGRIAGFFGSVPDDLRSSEPERSAWPEPFNLRSGPLLLPPHLVHVGHCDVGDR